MAKSKSTKNQLKDLPEYGTLIRIMQDETASIVTDYIRQYVGVASRTPEPGSGVFMNFDRVLKVATYQELAWYDLYQEVGRDPHIGAVMDSARLDVAGMPWDVTAYTGPTEKKASARNEEIARFVKRTLEGTGYFAQHLFNLMDAVGMGFSVSEIVWNPTDEGVVIGKILNRPQRRFQFDAVSRTLKLRNLKNPYYGDPLPDKKFICHRVSAQWENPFGDALYQSIYWMWLFKRTVIKYWMKHLDVGSSSIPIVKHPQTTDPALKAEALEIAEMIRNGAYGRIPDSFEIEWAEAKNAIQNAQTYESFVKMCDEQVSKRIEGQTLTTDTGISGTRAQGQVHEATKSTRVVFRARGLEGTLNPTLIKWLVDLNFADVDGYPQFKFDLGESEDLGKEATIVQTLSNAGYDFDEQELSDKFNYTITKKKPLELGPKKPGEPVVEEEEEVVDVELKK